MILPRVIPCLLLRDKGLVKGVKFKNHEYIGDPINAVSIFNTMEVDELLFLDIDATRQNRIPPLPLIQKIADQCLMPFGIGGGIKTISDIKTLLNIGAEKVCLNTYALENPDIIKKASSIFGNQSIVVSVDYKTMADGKLGIYSRCGTKMISRDFISIVKLIEAMGAGEIILNSIDRDGTMKGFDIKSIKEVASVVKIPVIALGGAGSVKDLKDGIDKAGASAVSAGSMFVFHGRRKAVLINYPSIKELKYI
ncbi:MAG: AglZ/HisF2 family acetamidino modification protein, partial [Patescibacteria group bacterium]|nr:AglZ/HisF2 family acetamidino modification protein [Patescibacteria group bacterium]